MPERCIPRMVSTIAAQQPHAPALICAGQRTTYAELESRSNQLAGYLTRQGVGPDAIVGIALGRSADFVVAALGILKAGGAYLPLDPSYPRERLELMIGNAALRLVVTDQAHAAVLPLDAAKTVLMEDLASEPAEPPNVDLDPHSLAYVIYTSGSTGRPKGVMVEHGSLLNLVDWHCQAFAISASDRASLVSSPSFDAAVWETWPYLASGACLLLPDEATRQDAAAMRDWLLASGLTISFVPTPLAEAMLALDWPESAKLRFLLTGADVLHHHPRPGLPFQLVNNYGPTECTVVTTSAVIPPRAGDPGPPPIGPAVANVEVRVLDGALAPVATGQPGELFVGGAGLARGYLGQPELTAASFVLGPDGTRLYRTGDVVRQLPDGALAFVGRSDEQVKIRGYRIELGEVTWALEQHPGVEAGVVAAWPDAAGQPTLVAYVVPRQAGLSAAELREFMGARLPDHMLPAAFVELEALPLAASGKVARAQLPEPGPDNLLGVGEATEAPGGIVGQLAGLVAELLGQVQVAHDANFFLLGGHSLFAAQLSARIRDAFGIELPLRTVFDAPTIAGLAVAVDRLLVAAVDALTDAEARSLLA